MRYKNDCFITSLLFLALTGCATLSGRPTPQPLAVLSPCPLQATPGENVPISFLVLTDSDGAGNPLWTQDYLTQLLASASTLVTRPGFFVLDRRQEYNTDILFPLEQVPLALRLCPVQPQEQFTVLISQPNTTDSAGGAPATSGEAQKPCFVMRSRHTTATPETVTATAAILVHELGHLLGYGEAPGGADGIHADHWTMTDEGQARLTQWQGTIRRRCGGS